MTGRPRSLAVLLALVVAACSPAPAPVATGALPSTAASPASTTGASLAAPSFAAAPALADALRDAIDPATILADLERLEALTLANGGARPAGSPAHDAAAAFVADELRAAGLVVQLQPVELPFFSQPAPSVLEIVGGGSAFEDLHDLKAMLFSASGDVTAPIRALGFNPLAGPETPAGLGCSPDDWSDVPAGIVVLVQPGPCRRHDVVVNAQSAGVLALITAYPGWVRDSVLRPTLINPDDIRIPVVGVTHAAGLELNEAASAGAQVHLRVTTTIERRQSSNVIAETPGGDPGRVLMIGGHLDSVVDGPGINDNGSGTMTVLEIARRAAAALASPAPGTSPWKVRVAFWTGEEIGLWGSSAYVDGLDGAARESIAAYLNFDMVGSSNGVRQVYDGADTANPTEGAAIAGLFAGAFERDGLVWQSVPLGGSSDHFPFTQAGLTTGGLFSGANELKSDAQAGLFGGTGGASEDPCYHLACDTVANIDTGLLGQMARAAAWVTGALASGEVVLEGS